MIFRNYLLRGHGRELHHAVGVGRSITQSRDHHDSARLLGFGVGISG